MTVCNVCSKVKLIKHYKDLGVCAKCYKDQTRNTQKQCISCLENLAVSQSSSSLCKLCEDRKVHIHNTRPELLVKKFLENDTDLPPAIHNKSDPHSRTQCSRSRVDFRLDFTFFQVIIEVDENQHKSYGEACELTRLLEVVNSAGGIPLMIFRINPDKYKQNGVSKNMSLDQRLIFMKERILLRYRTIIRRISNSTSKNIVLPILYVEYLFFDEKSSQQNFTIRTYLHDTTIASAIRKCK
jgi:hypothetical protein